MKRWTAKEEQELVLLINNGVLYKEIAYKFGRGLGSIKHKAMQLGIKSKNNPTIPKNIEDNQLQCKKDYESKIPDTILALETYIDPKTKILHKCKVCGYKYKSSPKTVLQSSKCPQCSGHIKTTHKYIEEVGKVNKNVTVIGEYIAANSNIEHKCNTCGNTWYPSPNSILKGHGCPKCCNSTQHFDTNPAILYVVYFPKLNLYKVGITSNLSNRQKSFGHTSEILYIREFNNGIEAKNLEAKYLINVKDLLINTGKLKSGNTETFRMPNK